MFVDQQGYRCQAVVDLGSNWRLVDIVILMLAANGVILSMLSHTSSRVRRPAGERVVFVALALFFCDRSGCGGAWV